MKYLRSTLYLPLILGNDELVNNYRYEDGARAAHVDMKGHTGMVIILGQVASYDTPVEKNLNAKSLDETKTAVFGN